MKKIEDKPRTDELQINLFEQNSLELNGVSLESAALKANVSIATIRNWVKTGYLSQEKNGHIDAKSFELFLTTVVGKEKLTSRANKSQKDTHDHIELTSLFFIKIKEKNTNFVNVSDEYEASLSESYKNREGIYYTPESITSDLLKGIEGPIENMKFLDPCCGSGNFIMRALELGFSPENVYGYDTDPIAVEIAKRRILERTGYSTPNIKNQDFLEAASDCISETFDVIYTNPPWGKKLSKDEKENYGDIFKAGKSVDTCSLFFFACLEYLNKNGELAFLLPDSFFNIATFESARKKALSLNIIRLIDYGKPFKGLMTKAFALVLRNNNANPQIESILCEFNNKIHTRSLNSFVRNPKSIINFQSSTDSANIIEHMFTLPHITLSGYAKWGLGIVTGNNEKFFKSNPEVGYIPVYRGSDIKKTGIQDPACYIPGDLTLYQQVAPLELYQAKTKLIYKFISADLCFYCDTEQRYVLNSANILIPTDKFPLTPMQLCDLLNSKLVNWLFSELFKTHKILRGDIEALPIHSEYFRKFSEFNESSYLNFLAIEGLPNGTYRIKK